MIDDYWNGSSFIDYVIFCFSAENYKQFANICNFKLRGLIVVGEVIVTFTVLG